jgi:hypothetical protein
VDNINNRFTSAAEALNYGSDMATGDYLFFCHQDIVIKDKLTFNYCCEFLSKQNCIIGVAGKKESDKDIYGNVTDLGSHNRLVPFVNINKPELAITVDECFFGLTKSTFQKYKFNEETCHDWHLYSAELSYRSMLDGIETYVLPINMHHNSNGKSMSREFYRTLDNMCSAYRSYYPEINTTCCKIGTGGFLSKVKMSHYRFLLFCPSYRQTYLWIRSRFLGI